MQIWEHPRVTAPLGSSPILLSFLIIKEVRISRENWLYISLFFFQYTDYEKVVEGYGGKGLRLETDDVKTIYETFQKAKEIAKDGEPVVINALIGKSDFRAGSISV